MRFYVLSLLLLAVLATAAAPLAQSRLTGFDLLRMTPSARAAALAGAYTAGGPVASPDAMFFNPAFLEEDAHDTASLGYLNHLDDVWMGFASYARRVDRIEGTVGLAVRHLGYGSFERRGFDGVLEGSYGASETAVTATYSRAVTERLRAGASVHAAFVALDDLSASALAADLGAAYLLPEQGVVLSVAVRNLGVALSSLGETEDLLPTDLRISVSKRLQNLPLRLTVSGYDLNRFGQGDGSALEELARHTAASGEFLLGSALALRVGYDYRMGADLGTGERLDLAGLGLGFGLNLRRFGFDYAYNSWSSFGGLHHVTVRARL
jgi:hypothetical protein